MNRAFNHLGHDIGGLARFGSFGLRHGAFFFDQVGRHVGGSQCNRLHGGYVHGNVFGSGFIAIELHHHANAGAMQISHQFGAIGKTLEAAEAHVFADFADQAFAHVFQCGAEAVLLIRQRAQSINVGWIVLRDQCGCGLSHGQEAVVLGHEVGFAVHFDQGANIAGNMAGHSAFGGDTRSGFAGLVAQLDAQNLFCFGHVAIGFGQGFLALHHGGVGFRAQFCDHACCNCCHRVLLHYY